VKSVLIAVGLSVLLAIPARAAPPPREVVDEDVDRAIGQATRYLWGQQLPDGTWRYHGYHQVPRGGTTALALFALLEAGERLNGPGMTQGIDALVALETENTYVIAVRTMVLSHVVHVLKNPAYRTRLLADVKWLTKDADRHGAWGYHGPETHGDNSVSQFALLALWEARHADLDVPARLVRRVEQTWLKRQRTDGGWTYAGLPNVKGESTPPMTAAGLASLYICQDVLNTASGAYPHQKARDEAWDYLVENLSDDYIGNGYLAFCIQRVGMASGRKFIGEMDWFGVGAAKLAEPRPRGRGYRGKWGPIVRACFELIFLSRGRIPLTFNKLEYGEEKVWNYHNRDVPRFTDYMRRNFEMRMRWQVVRVSDDVRLMLDGPILLVGGARPLEFSPEQWARLREYTLRGGTLLFVPTNNSKPFLESVKAALGPLYAAQREQAGGHYELAPLPDDHAVYTLHTRIPRGSRVAPVLGLSDGTRLLVAVCERDIARSWQRRAMSTGQKDFQLGVNFFLYATGMNEMKMRMRPVFPGTTGEARQSARIARLRHGGNWATQPYGLEYLSQKLIAENRVKIDLTAGAPITADALRDRHLAWMTGASGFTLSDAELAALREYLFDGGLLFVNAVGGAEAFRTSAEAMIERLFVGLDVQPRPVPATSGLITGKCGDFRGPPIETPVRTSSWRRQAPRDGGLQLQLYGVDDTTLVIYAPYGVHDTLDGHTVWGALSYMPASARDIAANIVLYSLVERPRPTRPVPATAPATQETTTQPGG